MLPTKKTYKIQVRPTGDLASEVLLTTYTDDPKRFRLHGALDDDRLSFPWMTRQEIVLWFRKAADLIEEAKFE